MRVVWSFQKTKVDNITFPLPTKHLGTAYPIMDVPQVFFFFVVLCTHIRTYHECGLGVCFFNCSTSYKAVRVGVQVFALENHIFCVD